MKKIITIHILLFFAIQSFAWGPTGHRVTGWIAEKHIHKKTRKEIERILSGQSLAMASTWMDEIRSDSTYNYTSDWHWVTIPIGKSYQETEKNSNGDIIQTIQRLIAELKSKKLSTKAEAENLKMLIHLIGDIHQPLHVGLGNDRGGNDIKVSWFRSESNLHRVWDSDMIDDTRLSYTELAESLEKPDGVRITSWQNSTVLDWATESISYRDQVYKYGNGKLGYRYSYENLHIVRYRLLQAGIRLAGVLNDIYG
ncbi:S1/P1 nuclease [Chryseolinea sp. H1M3-3]|uniref:S1/P1 nuclease n=1 Tax=Chryseolinea sp. H1M3-3 TaxID=3034144 RepID=UPI0023EAD6D0|nr:S1/P1 nuclease [Chryseolinea sp. H1M3-3]